MQSQIIIKKPAAQQKTMFILIKLFLICKAVAIRAEIHSRSEAGKAMQTKYRGELTVTFAKQFGVRNYWICCAFNLK